MNNIFPGKQIFFVFRSPMKYKEKINKEGKVYKLIYFASAVGITAHEIFCSLVRRDVKEKEKNTYKDEDPRRSRGSLYLY